MPSPRRPRPVSSTASASAPPHPITAPAWTGTSRARRGRTIVFCEVKHKADDRFGDPFEMIDAEKQRRIRQAAETWLSAHAEFQALEVRFDAVAVRERGLERLADAF